MLTALLMVFSIRTRHALFDSRPHGLVTALALGTCALGVALPFTTVGDWLGFAPPPAGYFGFLLAIVAVFLVAMEVAKQAFYKLLAVQR